MKHQSDLEQIELIVERIDPNATIHLRDITGLIDTADQSSEISKAIIMLLKKYGISFEDGEE